MTTIILTITIVLFVTVQDALAYPARPRWMSPMEWAVSMCETGMNWRHSTRDYGGAYGFARSSWIAFAPAGYPSRPELASPWQQTLVARRIRARYGWTGWGCVTHGGYRYWIGRA